MTTESKILRLDQLERKTASLRRRGKKIAFTNGCFDILHYGHVSYLQAAKKNNRVLVVGLNSDRSVRQLKGPGRPVNHECGRAVVMSALACVDYVVVFDEGTPQKVIEAIRPDILIKGADWKGKEVVGAKFVRSYGGRVEFIKYIPNYSTTKIIKRIAKSG